MTDHDSQPAAHRATDRLRDGVGELRVPEPSADTERALFKLSLALPLVGLVAIVAGYWGASGTKYPADAISYMISGGLLGLGLILVGLGLFLRFSVTRLLRFWLARLVHEHQSQTDRVVDALASIEAAIKDATTDQPIVVHVPKDAAQP